MAKVSTNLGKVATTPKGEYNSATNYVKLDVVTYNGSSYVCLKDSVGNLPTDTEYWQLLASKGDVGQDGYTPVKGVDYFTEEDIESLNIPTNLSELNEDTTHRVVTDEEKTSWNNKSEFSGSYNDLTNKPDIPSATSDLTNDSGFITNSVNDLLNYYLKSETYTKEEVNTIIANIQQFHYEVVATLPETGESNIMYLVPKSTSQTSNYYDEYVYSNGWEKIGDTEVDLTNYVTITALNNALADYTSTVDLTTLLNEKQDTLEAGENISIDNGVISANMKSYIITNNNYQNPFIFNEHDVGIYYFQNTSSNYYNAETQNIYVTGIKNGQVSTLTMSFDSYIIYDTKLVENQRMSIGWLVRPFFKQFGNAKFTAGGSKLTALSNGAINNSSSNNNYEYLNLHSAQTITGVKTFNALPQSSVVPTLDNQLVNKKYVDDQIGDINTILATLTTVEEGE